MNDYDENWSPVQNDATAVWLICAKSKKKYSYSD